MDRQNHTTTNQSEKPAKYKHPATGDHLAVRVDGKWMTHAAEYGPTCVFWRHDEWDHLDEGRQIDITEDNVCWVPEYSTPYRLQEYSEEGGVTTYTAKSELQIDTVEVHDILESQAHECFPGYSTQESE